MSVAAAAVSLSLGKTQNKDNNVDVEVEEEKNIEMLMKNIHCTKRYLSSSYIERETLKRQMQIRIA